MTDRARDLNAGGAEGTPPSDPSVLSPREIEQVYINTHTELERSVRRRVNDPEAARDIVQDVFLRLNRIAQSFKAPSEARFYLLRMAHNMSRDHVRNDKIRARAMEGLAVLYDTPAETQESVVMRLQSAEQARQAIETLSERQRDMLRRSRILGQGYKEIARDWGVSVRTVEFEIGRALKLARKAATAQTAPPPALAPPDPRRLR